MYTYEYTSDVNIDQLADEIYQTMDKVMVSAPGDGSTDGYLEQIGNTLKCHFNEELTTDEKNQLDTIVANHVKSDIYDGYKGKFSHSYAAGKANGYCGATILFPGTLSYIPSKISFSNVRYYNTSNLRVMNIYDYGFDIRWKAKGNNQFYIIFDWETER